MLGAGGVVAVILSAWAGRLPILFYFLVLSTATAAWCAAATTFESFMAARILNGFFSTVAQGGGLMFIFDMFFFHERARKINIWAYYCLTFAWVVGINTTLAIFLTPLYNFGPKQIGFFYFTPIVAAILGEVCGHWLHDGIAKRYIKKHNGHFEPEVRLRTIWLSTPFMIAGLVGLGFALEDAYHYMLTSLFWGLYVFGIMITTVALVAYNLDSYPEASGEVSALINMARSKSLSQSTVVLDRVLTSYSNWWFHHQLLPGYMGTVKWHESKLWHTSWHLCWSFCDCCCSPALWKEVESKQRPFEFCHSLTEVALRPGTDSRAAT